MKNTLLPFLLILCGCAVAPSAEMAKSWMEPFSSMNENPDDKILVVALVKDEVSRRAIEYELARNFNGHAIASFAVLQAERLKNGNDTKLNQLVTSGQYTHILLMRLADPENEKLYVPGGNYGMYVDYDRY